jgi:SNF2 family DNA or RNA helicase
MKNLMMSKVENLRVILGKDSKKVIVFSNYDENFIDVKKVLGEMSITHSSLTGTGGGSYVTSAVKRFQESRSSAVLLVNSRSNGCSGLNLDTASDLIIMNRLEPLIYNQLVGLVNRPGRVRPLDVWHFLNVGET